MKKSRYSPEQVAFGRRQAEEGTPVSEVCRKMGISEQTFYRGKKKLQGMGVAEVWRLRVLNEENRKLRQLVAGLSLDKRMLQDVLRKSPEAGSVAVPGGVSAGGVRRQRAPGLSGADPAPGQHPGRSGSCLGEGGWGDR